MSDQVSEEGAEAPEPQAPLLRVVKGDPTAEELAALVTVVSAMAGAAEGEAGETRSSWSSHHRKLRASHAHGPDGWRQHAR